MILYILILVLFINVNSDNNITALTTTTTTTTSRVYHFKKCGGAGCPYTASWLVHVNLYKRANWYISLILIKKSTFL